MFSSSVFNYMVCCLLFVRLSLSYMFISIVVRKAAEHLVQAQAQAIIIIVIIMFIIIIIIIIIIISNIMIIITIIIIPIVYVITLHHITSAGQKFRSLARIHKNGGRTWRKPKTEVVR